MGDPKAPVVMPSDAVIMAVKMGEATVYVGISKADVGKLKKHAGSIGSYSPTAFKLADCPTPQTDGSVLKVTVPLVVRTMNSKVPKVVVEKVVEDNLI